MREGEREVRGGGRGEEGEGEKMAGRRGKKHKILNNVFTFH